MISISSFSSSMLVLIESWPHRFVLARRRRWRCLSALHTSKVDATHRRPSPAFRLRASASTPRSQQLLGDLAFTGQSERMQIVLATTQRPTEARHVRSHECADFVDDRLRLIGYQRCFETLGDLGEPFPKLFNSSFERSAKSLGGGFSCHGFLYLTMHVELVRRHRRGASRPPEPLRSLRCLCRGALPIVPAIFA